MGNEIDGGGIQGDLERQKIESEIARNAAEKDKIQSEALLLRRQLDRRWYSSKIGGQIIATFVAALIIAIWVAEVVQPLFDKRNESVRLESEISGYNVYRQYQTLDSLWGTMFAEN